MSTWCKTGTVSVTNGSGTVTGTGTAWVTALQIGDAIWLPDGRAYEVTGVISATSLTISPNYAGATASGQAYRVQPTRGMVQQLLATVQTWLINGQRFDFADLPEGATLSAEAIASDWITDPVTREGGRVHLTFILPRGWVADPDAPEAQAVLFPVPLVLDTDGLVDLPSLPPEATPDDAD